MKTLLTPEELDDCLADLRPEDPEYESYLFLRDAYYLRDEGFIDIEGDRCYPRGDR